VNSLEYGGRSDFPIGEFWTEREFKEHTYEDRFPDFHPYWYHSMKGLASVANTYGKSRVGAEAFTGWRGWIDHPYLIKGMGDEAFSEGVSHFVIHLSAHQAYDSMKPGLTHSRWGQHFNRHQTWWEFSKPWFDYVARCQFLLQQGRRVVDVACLYHEGAPLNFNDIQFELPPGYDHDFCSEEIVGRMTFKDGRIHLPTGVSYRHLVLPRNGRLTLPVARKVEELRKQGAAILLQAPITGTPGLEGYPQADEEVRKLAAAWPLLPKGGWNEVFAKDQVAPDFEGEGLKWITAAPGTRTSISSPTPGPSRWSASASSASPERPPSYGIRKPVRPTPSRVPHRSRDAPVPVCVSVPRKAGSSSSATLPLPAARHKSPLRNGSRFSRSTVAGA
jgi:hypothetical protein